MLPLFILKYVNLLIYTHFEVKMQYRLNRGLVKKWCNISTKKTRKKKIGNEKSIQIKSEKVWKGEQEQKLHVYRWFWSIKLTGKFERAENINVTERFLENDLCRFHSHDKNAPSQLMWNNEYQKSKIRKKKN